jgi:uncharacterized protein YjaZ
MKRILIASVVLLVTSVNAGQVSSDVNVVAVYEGIASYLEALAANPAANRKDLWQSKVTTPYWKACAEGGEYIEFGPSLATPLEDTPSLRAAVAALRASPIQQMVRSAVEKSSLLLPTPSTTVCIFATDSGRRDILDMHGVSGFTAGAGKIWLFILPVGDWKDWITYGVAHEYHHSVWTRRHGRQDPIEDMADYLVLEGRGDSFARLVDPQRLGPWASALTPKQEEAAWRIIQRNLRATSAQQLQGLMFGGGEGVPRWGGYTIGFAIVQSYLKAHPDLNVNEWTAIEAAEIVRKSPYASEQ